jgi:hypothetical protein
MENNNEHKKDIGMCENFMVKKIAEFGQSSIMLYVWKKRNIFSYFVHGLRILNPPV